MQVRIAGVVPESFVDGSGIRFAIFMQGCLRRCHGCHNPKTHKLTDGNIIDTEDVMRQIESRRKILSGITLTGGEPLLQFDAALELARGAWCRTCDKTLRRIEKGNCKCFTQVARRIASTVKNGATDSTAHRFERTASDSERELSREIVSAHD